MIKKYFAMSIIAASVAMTACSDDDDDDEGEMPTTEMPTTEMPASTESDSPGTGGTVYDTIVNSVDHTTLRAAIDAAGLAATLDDGTARTVFAPDNDAFTALDADEDDATPTVEELLADPDALARILKYHVLGTSEDATALTQIVTDAGDEAATVPTILVDGDGTAEAVTQTVTLTAEGPLQLAVNGTSVTQAGVSILSAEEDESVVAGTDVPAVGVVHVIDGILIPPAAPEVTTPPETETPGTETPGTETPPTGAVDTALADLGTYEIFRSSVNRDFGGTLETNAWTVFVPSDATLGTAGVSDLTAAQQQAHIISSGALTPEALADTDSVTASDGSNTYVVEGDATAGITVDGKAVSLIATGTGGAQIYSIDGVLGVAAPATDPAQ